MARIFPLFLALLLVGGAARAAADHEIGSSTEAKTAARLGSRKGKEDRLTRLIGARAQQRVPRVQAWAAPLLAALTISAARANDSPVDGPAHAQPSSPSLLVRPIFGLGLGLSDSGRDLGAQLGLRVSPVLLRLSFQTNNLVDPATAHRVGNTIAALSMVLPTSLRWPSTSRPSRASSPGDRIDPPRFMMSLVLSI